MKIEFKNISVTNKSNVLENIVEVASEQTGLSKNQLLNGFKTREEQTSTGMIEGIAIPHTMQEVSEPHLVVVKFKPINDWDTLDGSKVELAVAIIAPSNGEEHLRLLSQISRKFMNSDNITALKAAKDVEEIRSILDI